MLDKIALALMIIGGLNWGLVGIFGFDLVAWLFGGAGAMLSRVVYILVHNPSVQRACTGSGTRVTIPKSSPLKEKMTAGDTPCQPAVIAFRCQM